MESDSIVHLVIHSHILIRIYTSNQMTSHFGQKFADSGIHTKFAGNQTEAKNQSIDQDSCIRGRTRPISR